MKDNVKQSEMPNTPEVKMSFSHDGDVSTVDVTKVLQLAGKLAVAARMVTNSNARGLSYAIEYMEIVLDEYDSEVMDIKK